MSPNPNHIPDGKSLRAVTKEEILDDVYRYIFDGYCDKEKAQAFSEHWVATIWDGTSYFSPEIKRTIFWDWNEWNGWAL